MSADEEADARQPEPALARALDRWKTPPAREEFRARLRAQFLAAPFEARVEGEGLDSEPRIHVEEPLRLDFSLERRRKAAANASGRRRWGALAGLAAIAALVLIVMRWPAASSWSVLPASSFTQVTVDGREFQRDQSAQLAAALSAGSRVQVEGGTLQLSLDRRLALGLSAGSSLQLSEIPASTSPAQFLLRQERGTLAAATGPQFKGSGLRIQTPQGLVRVLGTQFVVDIIPGEGTCICCCEGQVEVSAGERAAFAVPSGRMGFLFEDGRDPQQGGVIDLHLAPIESLRRLWSEQR